MSTVSPSPNYRSDGFAGKSPIQILKTLWLMLLCSPLVLSQSTQLHGVDLNDINRKVDPCTDFYEFANGTWRANNPIPASMTRWSKRWQAEESSKDKLRDILEEAVQTKNAPKGSSEQLIGDYYAACTDQARIDAHGLEPLKPWLAKIEGAKDKGALQSVMFEMHDVGVFVALGRGRIALQREVSRW